MTSVYRAALGPTFLEKGLLVTNGLGVNVNVECVAVTDGDAAPAPVANCYWIREVANAGITPLFQVGPGPAAGPAGGVLAYEWAIIEAHRIEGTLSDTFAEENVCEFEMDGGGGDVSLKFDPLGVGTFRYRLTQGGGANSYGSGVFNTSTNCSIRFEFNGTTCIVDVNGSFEAAISCTDMPLIFQHSGSNLVSAEKQYWCGFCWRGSNDQADRPNTTLTVEGKNPTADFESADFGDQAICGVGGDGDWNDWDDDGADDSNTAIYLCEGGGVDTEETSEFEDLTTITEPKIVFARFLMRANMASKTVRTHCRAVDAGTPTSFEIQNNNVSSTVFRGYGRPYVLTPSGGAWTEDEVNDLRSGIAVDSATDAQLNVAMQRLEVFDLGDDPPLMTFDPTAGGTPVTILRPKQEVVGY